MGFVAPIPEEKGFIVVPLFHELLEIGKIIFRIDSARKIFMFRIGIPDVIVFLSSRIHLPKRRITVFERPHSLTGIARMVTIVSYQVNKRNVFLQPSGGVLARLFVLPVISSRHDRTTGRGTTRRSRITIFKIDSFPGYAVKGRGIDPCTPLE